MIRVLDPGVFTTVQDLGRAGFSALGVPSGGAADPLSLRAANTALGNPADAAALELTMLGGRFLFEHPALAIITGGGAEVWADGDPVPIGEAFHIRPGGEIRVGRVTAGFRAYLGIAGGVDVQRVFSSASTDPTSAFGGHHGRILRPGDTLALGPPTSDPPRAALPPAWRSAILDHCRRRVLRAVPGPHVDAIPGAPAFWETPFTVTSRSNRAGLRLAGPAIATSAAGHLPSEGMMPGAVQVPHGGQPIILMPDGPTTGGYPVVAIVAAVDLPALGQLPPNTPIRFEPITIAQARELWLTRERALELPA